VGVAGADAHRTSLGDNLSGGGTGLAEIELPSNFKSSNIQSTAMAEVLRDQEERIKRKTYHVEKRARGICSTTQQLNFRYSQPQEAKAPNATGGDGGGRGGGRGDGGGRGGRGDGGGRGRGGRGGDRAAPAEPKSTIPTVEAAPRTGPGEASEKKKRYDGENHEGHGGYLPAYKRATDSLAVGKFVKRQRAVQNKNH
jgi:hypothetical protein